jgi:hypothetical protein
MYSSASSAPEPREDHEPALHTTPLKTVFSASPRLRVKELRVKKEPSLA